MQQWKRNRVTYLQQASKGDQALELQRQLAIETPHEWNVQRDYAQALFNAQLPEQGYAWLDRVLVPESKWLPSEEGYLRQIYAEQLRNQGRYEELVEYLAETLASNPTDETLYRHYLSALFQTDRIDEVNRVIAQWMAEGRTQEKLPNDVVARINAATSQALGEGYHFQTNRLDERWLDPLSEIVRFFAAHKTHARLAERVMNHHRFQQTDHCRAIRG
jgi:tetratricopeptide (TPR) repeat protein